MANPNINHYLQYHKRCLKSIKMHIKGQTILHWKAQTILIFHGLCYNRLERINRRSIVKVTIAEREK